MFLKQIVSINIKIGLLNTDAMVLINYIMQKETKFIVLSKTQSKISNLKQATSAVLSCTFFETLFMMI